MKTVLIAEDNRDIRTILKERLEKDGFTVMIANGGYAVLGYLRKNQKPDFIILDLLLPERSGIELLDSLKSKWPDTKIFIYSAHTEFEGRLRLFKEHISGFFIKTDGFDKLIDAIKKEC